MRSIRCQKHLVDTDSARAMPGQAMTQPDFFLSSLASTLHFRPAPGEKAAEPSRPLSHRCYYRPLSRDFHTLSRSYDRQDFAGKPTCWGANLVLPEDSMSKSSRLIMGFAALGLAVAALILSWLKFMGEFDATLYTAFAILCPPALLCIP